MKITSLNDLLIDMVKDMYSAETQLTKALPKMVEKASTDKLKQAFQEHLKETENQIQRLDKVCEILGVSPKGQNCEAMEGLIKEAEEMISDIEDADTLDAGLIAAAQKVEHYEIASYGTLITYAQTLEDQQVANILKETISEEKQADQKLTQIAERMVNEKAKA